MTDLDDQIAEYNLRYPPVDIYSPPGTRIVFHGRGGYPLENKRAHATLTVGETYTIAGSVIGSWDASFCLDGVSGWFNSVLFSPAQETPHE